MKIAVIGAGAIGCIVAAKLVKSGQDVVLVGREDQVRAVEKDGLTVKTHQGSEKIRVPMIGRMNERYDLVIFSVKTQDLEQAYQDNREFLENVAVLTTQNGVQADNILSCHFEPEQMISSIVMFGSTYIRAGEIVDNFPGKWIIGKPYRPNDRLVWDVAGVLQKAFDVVVTDEIMGMKWLKLFVNFNNCIPALIGRSMQETFADPDFCRLSIMLLKEGVGILEDAGIKLVSLPDFPVERITGLSRMPVEQGAAIMNKTLTGLSKEPLYGSILQSIKRGKTSEIDFINGEVNMIAHSLRTKATLNEKVVALVHQVENTGRFLEPEFVKKEFSLN